MTDHERREREDFEAWAAPIFEGGCVENMTRGPRGHYRKPSHELVWLAWQARAARAPEAAQGLKPSTAEYLRRTAIPKPDPDFHTRSAASEPAAQAEPFRHIMTLTECAEAEAAPAAQPDDLTSLRTKGAAAWADVPDASAWVEGVRGNAGTAERRPRRITFYDADPPYIDIDGGDLWLDISDLGRDDLWKVRWIVDAANRTLSRAPEPVSDSDILGIAAGRLEPHRGSCSAHQQDHRVRPRPAEREAMSTAQNLAELPPLPEPGRRAKCLACSKPWPLFVPSAMNIAGAQSYVQKCECGSTSAQVQIGGPEPIYTSDDMQAYARAALAAWNTRAVPEDVADLRATIDALTASRASWMKVATERSIEVADLKVERDRLSRATGAVPAGFALVLIEPTDDMLRAGHKAYIKTWASDDNLADWRNCYRACVAASPSAPTTESTT